MEIVSIEAGTFEEMNKILNSLIQIAQSRNEPTCKKLDEWIDNQDVCILMDISPRKLQTLRRSGAIPYSRIDRKIYYEKADIIQYMESILEEGTPKTEMI